MTKLEWRQMWHNGARPLLAGALMFLVALIVLFAASLYAVVHAIDAPEPNPLSSPSPEQIVNQLPAYHVGDSFVTLGSKCNNSKLPVRIVGSSFWESQESGGPSYSTNNNVPSGRDIPPGCMPLQFPHVIPAVLTPGKWALTGRDCVVGTAECADWFTATFVVAP